MDTTTTTPRYIARTASGRNGSFDHYVYDTQWKSRVPQTSTGSREAAEADAAARNADYR